MSEPYAIATISQLELPANPADPEWRRWAIVRHHFGITGFGVNAWTSNAAGQELIEEHDELGPRAGGHEELYFIAAGRATFTIDGEEVPAPAGSFVFVHPQGRRRAVAEEPETTVIAVGGKVGEAFQPSQWERAAPAFAYWATGEFDKAIVFLANSLETYPDDAGVLYNLACAESMAGRRQDAIAHLRRAIELDGDFRDAAEKDTDFDAVRDDPAFGSAVAGQPDTARSSP